jgi:hypothetical protein
MRNPHAQQADCAKKRSILLNPSPRLVQFSSTETQLNGEIHGLCREESQPQLATFRMFCNHRIHLIKDVAQPPDPTFRARNPPPTTVN